VILLYATLAVGPLVRLIPHRVTGALVPWRRQTGIWFGALALVHTALVWDGLARWDVGRLFGYEFIPQLDRVARIEPGFGLANLMGLAAIVITIPLLATSADWAMRGLGGATWKYVHQATYTIFWLVALHTAYFLFFHYTESFHRSVPPDPNWFRVPFLILTATLLVLQGLALAGTVRRQVRMRARRAAIGMGRDA
jgi:sulfoxide reductase heme-binding subunit YedZ